MDKLLEFLRSITPEERERFAKRLRTSVRYLYKAISVGHRMGGDLVVAIERESGGKVRCEDLRPDIDWAYVRGTARRVSGSPSSRASV